MAQRARRRRPTRRCGRGPRRLHRGRVGAAAAPFRRDGGAPPRPVPDALGQLHRGRLRGPDRALHAPARDQRPEPAGSSRAARDRLRLRPRQLPARLPARRRRERLGIDYGEESIRYSHGRARPARRARPRRSTSASRRSTTVGEPTPSRTTSRSRTASSTTSTTRTPPTARSTASSSRAAGSGSTPTAPAACQPRPVGRVRVRMLLGRCRYDVVTRGARLPRRRDEQALPPRRRAERRLPPHHATRTSSPGSRATGSATPGASTGGFPTDFDHGAIEADPYGVGEVRQRRHLRVLVAEASS